MKRFLVGLAVGILLGYVASAAAGFFYSTTQLLGQRGNAFGDSFVRGYIAGVYDLMAAWYPVNQVRLGDVENKVIPYLLRNSTQLNASQYPAAFWIVGALVEEKQITQEDAVRILPADALSKMGNK